MGDVMFYMPRKIATKGLNKQAVPNLEKVRNHIFNNHYETITMLGNYTISIREKPTLFYPGCGVDVLMPLLYVEKLFPSIQELTLIMNDVDDNLSMVQQILDDVGVHFNEQMEFYWNGKLVHLSFVQGHVMGILDTVTFDIYFERAFRIMRDEMEGYEKRVLEKLNNNGILISDSGFQNSGLKTINIPQQLSSYNEMIIGIKRS